MSTGKRFSSKGVIIYCPEPLIELIKQVIRLLDDHPKYISLVKSFIKVIGS